MAEKRDYYEVLGLDKSASADDIKGAYRKAALKWHPDRWVSGTDAEKKNAEEKFKEASEAYSVLSDPDKKARYDQFGFAGTEGGAQDWSQGFGNLNDILNDLFGGGFGGFGGGGFRGFSGFGGFGGQSNAQRVYRGRDIRTSVTLTLEEIATGVEKEITIERSRPCPDCQGKGTNNSSDIKSCGTCNGSGQVQNITNSIFGRTVAYSTCPQCKGEGKVITNPCRSCSGTGLLRKRETVKVKIPAGVEEGMQLTVHGEGHSAPHNGTNGDLLVVIKEAAHSQLRRNGNNLYWSQTISVTDAILGCEISVPCLDGSTKIKVDPGTQSGTTIKLRNKGLPSVNGYGSGRGDLFVQIFVWIPKKLNRDERKAIESMQKSESFKPDLSRDDKNLFEKLRKKFDE
ncbi:MAG: molecular chaperone DnaJ [Bacteroidia bacterium]|nr:molecular chaperone DnaJ [Bacteroidia bacterium]